MKISILSRPSPAMVVACIALSFALAGSAVAGTDALDKAVTKAKVKQIAKKQANKRITKRAPNLSVANADTVDGFHADFLVRSAFSQTDNDALVGPAPPGPIRTATIDAPTSGFLLINAGSDVFDTATSGRCGIEVDGTDIASSEREWELGANNNEEDCTTETTRAVAAGTHTVVFESLDPLDATARYDEAELQILFVPFGATGTQPASAAKRSPGGGYSDGN